MTPIAKAVLARFSNRHQPSDVQPLGNGGGFSGAVIVRVRTRVGEFCLRGWPKDGPPKRRILGLHRLLGSVFESGVRQVAVPVPAENGVTLVRAHGRYWHLEPWMPGRADFRANPNTTRLRAAMSSLAAWHRAAAAFRPEDSERRWFASTTSAPAPAVLERLEILKHWQSGRIEHLKRAITRSQSESTVLRELGMEIRELFEYVAPAVRLELELAAEQRVSLQPCLRDIWHDHVLFTGDEVTGLIDPAACRSDTVAVDLARLLGSLLGDEKASWDMALNEYGRHRPLAPDERALVPVLDHSGVLLSALTWLERCYLQGERWDDSQRVVARLERFVARLEHLSKRL